MLEFISLIVMRSQNKRNLEIPVPLIPIIMNVQELCLLAGSDLLLTMRKCTQPDREVQVISVSVPENVL